MRRFALALAIPLALVPPSPAGAGVTTDGAAWQTIEFLSVGDRGQGYRAYYYLHADNVVRATSSGAQASPTASFEAVAQLTECPPYPGQCTSTFFPRQQLSPTALSFDPIGNSGTFRATLIPDPSTPGPAKAFDLAFTRPQSMAVYCPGQGVPCAPDLAYNAWFDPTTNEVGVSAAAAADAAITRGRYSISGSFAGQPYAATTTYWSTYTTLISATGAANLP